MRTAITSALLCLAAVTASAQQTATSEKSDTDKATPVNIHGTIRSKYEYQTSEGEGRFEVAMPVSVSTEACHLLYLIRQKLTFATKAR